MTTDQQDIYSSHAAFSSLASTLLPRVQAPSQHKKTSNQTPTWNLKPSINEFFDLSRYRNDRWELLRCGTTIGLSWLREWGDANLQHRDLLGDVFLAPSFFLSNQDNKIFKFVDLICVGIQEAFDIVSSWSDWG